MLTKKSAKAAADENDKENKTKAPIKITQKEFEKMVIGLAEKNLTAEKIGENLRKQNIHPKEYDKKISKILKENKIYFSPDLKNAETKLKKIEKHAEKNKQDKRALNEKTRIFSRIRKIKEYNQRAG